MNKERKASIKNRGIISALSVLLIILVLTGAGGYTYARYMSQEKGTGSAQVANWSFKIDKNGQATKVINLANTVNKDTLVNGKIAPGTSGEFTLVLDATGSDVGVDYVVYFANEQNKPNNIQFTYNERKVTSLGSIGNITGSIGVKGNKTETIKINWTWPYQTGQTFEDKEKNDLIDTQNGTSPLDYTFEIVAKGTQSE